MEEQAKIGRRPRGPPAAAYHGLFLNRLPLRMYFRAVRLHYIRLPICMYKLKILAFTAALLALTSAAHAQNFSTTNLQALYGAGFDDWYYGNATAENEMFTLTAEHYTAFKTGDVFFFADYTRGDFVNAAGALTGVKDRMYSEVTLRISPFRLAGASLGGFIPDAYAAANLERDGAGFAANLIGGSIDLKLPGFAVANLSTYYRDDNFNEPTYQVSYVWNIPVKLSAKLQAGFSGFLDVHGTDRDGADLHTQPQLFLQPTGSAFAFGVEALIHTNKAVKIAVPQAAVKWTF